MCCSIAVGHGHLWCIHHKVDLTLARGPEDINRVGANLEALAVHLDAYKGCEIVDKDRASHHDPVLKIVYDQLVQPQETVETAITWSYPVAFLHLPSDGSAQKLPSRQTQKTKAKLKHFAIRIRDADLQEVSRAITVYPQSNTGRTVREWGCDSARVGNV